MTPGVCYRQGRETGAWYELKCLRSVIEGKEARGESATFERELYKAWLKTPEYQKADKENHGRGLYGTLPPLADKREVVAKIVDEGKLPVANYATEKKVIMKQRGRPRKEGEVHRVTEWRRRKEAEQGMLL